MFRTIVAITATLTAALWLSSCSKEIEYNSNSGYDGSRDSASQLLVNTSKVDDVSAPDGDNEDWFYFMPPSDGLVTVRTYRLTQRIRRHHQCPRRFRTTALRAQYQRFTTNLRIPRIRGQTRAILHLHHHLTGKNKLHRPRRFPRTSSP